MRKKQRISEKEQSNKIKQLKSAKSKNKEMFTELKTHEENKISRVNLSLPSSNNNQSQMVNEDDEISFDQNMQANIDKNNQDIEQICTIVHNLISKNKISAKNAFDVPFIDLQKLQDFEKISESENGWKKISSTLQNDSKIYSYRVDAIHSIAYKIMNTMTRNQDQQPVQPGSQSQSKQLKKQNILESIVLPKQQEFDIDVGLHLQKNIQNINMQNKDKVSECNPTYQITRRKFDQNGLRGMLLNNIQLDSNLQLSLNQSRLKSGGLFQKSMNVEVSRLTQQPTIFKNVENTRKAISQILKQDFVPATGYEISWRKIMNGELYVQRIETENKDNEMDIEYDSQRQQSNSNYRRVQDVIKLKKQKKSLKTVRDVAQDGMSWLSQKDMQMLGIKKNNSEPLENTLKKASSSVPQDGILFDKKIVLKEEVFTEQTIEKQKMEYNQEIEQKHLLPIKLFHKFKVEQIMTLRQEPPQNLQINMINQQEQMEKQRQIQQIDIKRQQISIRESKQKLKSLVLKEVDFKTLCKKFEIAERNVAPELCFLTVLHLANQNNLKLQQINDSNFIIKG